jgi:hypothetical protein
MSESSYAPGKGAHDGDVWGLPPEDWAEAHEETSERIREKRHGKEVGFGEFFDD